MWSHEQNQVAHKGDHLGLIQYGFTIREDLPKKECFLSGIVQISPPPLPSFQATWSSFFGRQKRRIACMTEISTDYDDDGRHDNYNGDGDNIDEIHDKNYQRTY